MAAPIQAHATAEVPGACELVQNTMCGQPATLREQLLAIIKWA